MNTEKKPLTISDALARKLYPTADAEFKAVLEENYGKDFFSLKLIDRINSWDDVAAEQSLHPVNCLPFPNPQTIDEISCNAGWKIQHTSRLFNGGRGKVDYSNPQQRRTWAWMKKGPSGFGFGAASTYDDRTHTYVGPRLEFLDREIFLALMKKPFFQEMYNQYYSE